MMPTPELMDVLVRDHQKTIGAAIRAAHRSGARPIPAPRRLAGHLLVALGERLRGEAVVVHPVLLAPKSSR